MKKCSLFVFAAAAISFCAVGCASLFGHSTFKVPEIGIRYDAEDSKGSFVFDEELKERIIDLKKYKAISYTSFELYPTEDIDFYAPMTSNAKDQARWYLRMPKNSTKSCMFTAFYSLMPIGTSRLEDLERLYKAKFRKASDVISCKTSYDVRGKDRILKYEVTAREEKTSRYIVVNGMMIIDINHPDHFYDIAVERRAYQRDINDERMLRATEYFIDTIRPIN